METKEVLNALLVYGQANAMINTSVQRDVRGTIIPDYKNTTPIGRIYCKDGESLSIQIGGYVHCQFAGIKRDELGYSEKLGSEVLKAETDCEDLNQYVSDDIDTIVEYIESHGGLDLKATAEHAVKYAYERERYKLERYKLSN